MSGGSYDYLFTVDADSLADKEVRLRAMADRLAGLGYAKDAAEETEFLILLWQQQRERNNRRIQRLSGVWKAIEWWDSCDSGEEAVHAALKQYRGEG